MSPPRAGRSTCKDMKRLLAALVALTCALSSFAQAPQPPEIAARQYLLIDLSSQQVLAERDADVPSEPASLTKLMTAYLAFAAIRDKKLTLDQTAAGVGACLGRAQGRRLVDVRRHDYDADRRGTAARHHRAKRQRLVGGAGRGGGRHARQLRGDDEQAGAGVGTEEHAVSQCHRADRARPPRLGTRCRHHRREDHHRLPGLLRLLLGARLHLQPHQAGQSQPAARPRPDGRRHEDRLHRGRRLLPGGQRGA